MKQAIIWLSIAIFIAACSTQHGVVKINNKEDSIPEDSVEYQLETFDGRFEAWYQLHNNPSMYRSQQYYENWNRQYVAAWNYNATSGRNKSFFEPIVGYEFNVDYGFELNHELFYYFQYVENVLKIQIMPGGPRSELF